MEICQMDQNVFVRHRSKIREQEKIGPDEVMRFAQDVDALVSLARARVSLIVSPPLDVHDRLLVHGIAKEQRRSATMFPRTLTIDGQELAYEFTYIA